VVYLVSPSFMALAGSKRKASTYANIIASTVSPPHGFV
jgi:hypothetical protein